MIVGHPEVDLKHHLVEVGPPWSRSVYQRLPRAIEGSGRSTRDSETAGRSRFGLRRLPI